MLLLAAAPAGVVAQQAPAGVAWAHLTPAQQKLLAQVHDQWASLPPARQRALARGSRIWLHMTPDEQQHARQRFRRWQRMTPQQRELLRKRWQQFRALPAAQQRAIRRNYRRFEQLPPWRRRMLRERWRNASPSEREQMIERMRRRMGEHGIMRGPLPVPGMPPSARGRLGAPVGIGGPLRPPHP